MEKTEDIVIVGAGIAGLATALGLHRLGIHSLVLESASELRVSGIAIGAWTNAWRALDALGVGDSLRVNHPKLESIIVSTVLGSTTAEMSLKAKGKNGDHECRCLRRKDLLETLANDLPEGCIRFSTKVVAIDDGPNHLQIVHLADGSTLMAKVLIGCDGVNSVVAQSMGHQKPSSTGRCAIRACAEFPDGHSFGTKFLQFFGDGYRSGFVPCNQNTVYWFLSYSPSAQDTLQEMEPSKLKQFALRTLGQLPKELVDVVERTTLDNIIFSPLRFRNPFSLFWSGAIYKENVCVTGDALHAMPPDMGQGGCAALEDAVVLARCLADVFLKKERTEEVDEVAEYRSIVEGMKRFAEARKWRSFDLISAAYMVGTMQQSSGKIMNFLRDRVLSRYMAVLLLKRADYDCGKLTSS